MKFKIIKTIRSKLILNVILILTIQVIILLAANIIFARTFYINKMKTTINNSYNEIIENFNGTLESIENTLNIYEIENNLHFTIVDSNYNIVYNTKSPNIDLKKDKNKDRIIHKINSLKDEKGIIVEKPVTNDSRNLDNKSEIITLYTNIENSSNYSIIVESYISSIEENVSIMNEFILYVTIFIIIIGIIIICLTSKKITKPIKEISSVAKDMANLNFNKRIEVDSTDELGILAQDINSMSYDLEKNIEQLKFINDKLLEDIKLKDEIDANRKEFIANVSHELKTPLALILGYTEMLKNNMPGIDKDFYYKVIIDETIKMNRMVKNLLLISEVEKNKSKKIENKINLNQLIKWVISKHILLYEKKNICIKNYYCSDFYILGEDDKVEEAIKNYLWNAIEHTAIGGIIEVSTEIIDEHYGRLSIYNDGEHIIEEDTSKVWNSFYKIDKARTRSDGGNGLGLYIVKTIITANHGRYGYNNINNGVEFWFDLPLITKD